MVPTTTATIESATAGALIVVPSPAALQPADRQEEQRSQKDPRQEPEEHEWEAQDAGVDAIDQRHGDRQRRDRNRGQHRAQWNHQVLIV